LCTAFIASWSKARGFAAFAKMGGVIIEKIIIELIAWIRYDGGVDIRKDSVFCFEGTGLLNFSNPRGWYLYLGLVSELCSFGSDTSAFILDELKI
jgi:hypothetical protein